jgi:hypothetical protein
MAVTMILYAFNVSTLNRSSPGDAGKISRLSLVQPFDADGATRS